MDLARDDEEESGEKRGETGKNGVMGNGIRGSRASLLFIGQRPKLYASADADVFFWLIIAPEGPIENERCITF